MLSSGVEMLIFAGIDWSDPLGPTYELHDPTSHDVIYMNRSINLGIGREERYCLGHFELSDGSFRRVSCPLGNRVVSGTQCDPCRSADLFGRTHYVNSITDVPTPLRAYFDHQHYLYLATYGMGLFKIGTAHTERIHARLLEQGALGAVVLTLAGNGVTARQEERRISTELSIPTVMSHSRKRAGLIALRDAKAMLSALQELAEATLQHLSVTTHVQTWSPHEGLLRRLEKFSGDGLRSWLDGSSFMCDADAIGQSLVRLGENSAECINAAAYRGRPVHKVEYRPVLEPSQLSLF